MPLLPGRRSAALREREDHGRASAWRLRRVCLDAEPLFLPVAGRRRPHRSGRADDGAPHGLAYVVRQENARAGRKRADCRDWRGCCGRLLQLAKMVGARVFVTSSSHEKIARAVEMGAEGGVNYRNDRVSKAVVEMSGGGVDIFSTVVASVDRIIAATGFGRSPAGWQRPRGAVSVVRYSRLRGGPRVQPLGKYSHPAGRFVDERAPSPAALERCS